jgi:hypothetical protein
MQYCAGNNDRGDILEFEAENTAKTVKSPFTNTEGPLNRVSCSDMGCVVTEM